MHPLWGDILVQENCLLRCVESSIGRTCLHPLTISVDIVLFVKVHVLILSALMDYCNHWMCLLVHLSRSPWTLCLVCLSLHVATQVFLLLLIVFQNLLLLYRLLTLLQPLRWLNCSLNSGCAAMVCQVKLLVTVILVFSRIFGVHL